MSRLLESHISAVRVARLDAVDRITGVAAAGVTVQHIVADVTQEADVEAAVATAVDITGRLDGLFACAGGSTCMGPLALTNVDDIRSTMELNYIGTFLCLKHRGTQMARQGGGSIVGCSSHAGQDSMRCLGTYGAAKAGLDHLCRVSADEMGRFGVRVNSVQPGIVATELMRRSPVAVHYSTTICQRFRWVVSVNPQKLQTWCVS